MNYYIYSIADYINEQISNFREAGNTAGRLLIGIPSLPAQETLALGKLLRETCHQADVELNFKVAAAQLLTWVNEPDAQQEVAQHGWLATGSLTCDRNTMAVGTDSCHLTILVGTETVTDAGSLADFHRCDAATIWSAGMQQSFDCWSSRALEAQHIAYDAQTLADFDTVLCALRNKYGLLLLGELLGNMTFASQEGRGALKELLRNLGHFGLPNMAGFNFKPQKHRTFSYYLDSAVSFFSYEMYMERGKKLKALNSIGSYNLQMPHDKLGDFKLTDEMLDALKIYVANNDETVKAPLKSADFVFIWETILKYKPKPEDIARPRIVKLSGSPIEVMLQALWSRLRDFRKAHAGVAITAITFLGLKFRHDYDTSDTAETANTEAGLALARLLGGVDDLLQHYIVLTDSTSDNEIAVNSNLLNPDLSFPYSKTAEPFFQFQIAINTEVSALSFAWRLPDIQSYRLADELIDRAHTALERQPEHYVLPAFHLPYYIELMHAGDEDEIYRVLSHGIHDSQANELTNIFTPDWQDYCRHNHDILAPCLEKVAVSYRALLTDLYERGIHSTLFTGGWQNFFNDFKEIWPILVHHPDYAQSEVAPMLLRAFLLVDAPSESREKWAVTAFEKSAIITILHPALLEMLQAQVVFLFAAFSTVATAQLKNTHSAFKDNLWRYYVDLAAIQRPLTGILSDENATLDINVCGKGLLHRIGSLHRDHADMTTKLLLRYDGVDDEEISDADIFRISRESRQLFHVLDDYRVMHPHANDGLSLAVYRSSDIQPVVAAVHEYLKSLATQDLIGEEIAEKYAIHITIFTASADETGIARWIEEWQERWEAAEVKDAFSYYRYCDFAISHRMISRPGADKTFVKMLETLDCDVFVFYDFIRSGAKGNDFEGPVDGFFVTQDTLKFPILEKSFCEISSPHHKYKRAQIISNRQFRINALHAEVMARIKHPTTPAGYEHVVLGYGDFSPWQQVIDTAHAKAEWVVCIDPCIDEKLIAETNIPNGLRRDIIGFGSGVGLHGESNYTVSTQQFYLADLERMMTESLKRVYVGGTEQEYRAVVHGIVGEAKNLAGLSLVRATGAKDQYIRDCISYAMANKIMPLVSGALCNQLFSIDAYRHWFDMTDDDNESRPDLLWLSVSLPPGKRLKIDARLIECKMAAQGEGHIAKAKAQISNGLHVLMQAFKPRVSVAEARPDQRYWHLQLHRLIAGKITINATQKNLIIGAMERLADGDFEINWGAAILTFWTDSPSATLCKYESYPLDIYEEVLEVDAYQAGYPFIRDLFSGMASDQLLTWGKCISYAPSVLLQQDIEEESDIIPDDNSIFDAEDLLVEADADDIIDDSFISVEIAGESTDTLEVEESKLEVVTLTETELPVLLAKREIPRRILLGSSINGARKVYWEYGHPELNNRHMLIFGNSGMGKTYAIQALLCEFGAQGQNSLIVDYTNGFLNNQLSDTTKIILNPEQHYVKIDKLPFSPFIKLDQEIDDGIVIPAEDIDVAKRVVATFHAVENLGVHQYSALVDAIEIGLQTYQELLTLDNVMDILEGFRKDGEHEDQSVKTLRSKIKQFVAQKPFVNAADGIGWADIFTDTEKRCHVFQLAHIDPYSSRLITEFILWDFYAYVRANGVEAQPKVVVLDEVQNLDQRLGSPLAKFLTEGRKFGISLISATQTLSNLKTDEQSRLFQAGHKLFFRPADPEIVQYAEFIKNAMPDYGDRQHWIAELTSLQKGECFSIGQSLNQHTGALENVAIKIRITALDERGL